MGLNVGRVQVKLGAAGISSRRCFVPAVPACPSSLKKQNEHRICPDHGAPEWPLIKAARRGSDSDVLDKNDAAILLLRNSLQAPMKIAMFSHKQSFIVAVQRKEPVPSAKLSCALRHSCKLADHSPEL